MSSWARGRGQGRERGRERGRRRGRGRGGAYRRQIISPAPPLGEIIVTIRHDEIESPEHQDSDVSRIRNSQYLTSYNWLGGDKSRIIVPGEPPKWTPLSDPRTLLGDNGTYYRDRNAARYPTYPLEPMVQAILIDKPEFPVTDVDIIGCNNTMGHLLRFVRGAGDPFRMLVQVLGKTVFFIRRENSPTETIPGIRGYGHTFPEAYTTWNEKVGESKSHHRVVKYKFADMQCLIRFEPDGFLPDLVTDTEETEEEPVLDRQEESINAEEGLPSIEEITLSDDPSPATEMAPQQLEIAMQGRRIPQCAVLDLKTRSRSKRGANVLTEELPRLWLTQTPNFILAHHTDGQFKHIRVRDARDDVKQWEETEQLTLRKFASLLQMIVSFVRSLENGRLEIEREEGAQVLNLRAQGGVVNSVLSPAVASRWDM
ncbi:hypothetical protein N7449_005348 [Penicillium cf. viridicatum]|uniref:Geranylgeranyl pyrophosphate synthetase n=1 Tax=Penicillium cf. viridicatum TaxID=2972119 RepID=A0A9W9SYY5_9EURO|nr:hypothetical protein N7449_005348 [Penicillium cf. viridicatum]